MKLPVVVLLCVQLFCVCAGEQCDKDWVHFGNNCYWKSAHLDTHDKNAVTCREMEANMVSIHSKEEDHFIANFTNKSRAWLGAKRNGREDRIVRQNGTQFDYNAWTNHHKQEAEEHKCVYINENGKWNYDHCDGDALLMCQKKARDSEELNRLMVAVNDKLERFNENIGVVSKSLQTTLVNQATFTGNLGNYKMSLGNKLSLLSKLLVRNIETNERCRSRWRQWRNKCYYISYYRYSYDRAQTFCGEANAIPVAIRSAEEEEFIRQTFPGSIFWLGGVRVNGTDIWKWSDGSDALYTNWNVPDQSKGHTQQCVQYHNIDGYSGRWRVYPCEEVKAKTLCEYELPITVDSEIDYACDDGWFLFKKKCHLFNDTHVNRDDNEKFCSSLNATLVSIHSNEENNFLKSKMIAPLSYWSGGYSEMRPGRGELVPLEKWSDHSAWDYSDWQFGEDSTRLFRETCITISQRGFAHENCHSLRAQICVKLAKVVPKMDDNELALQQLTAMINLLNVIEVLIFNTNSPSS